MSDHTGEVIIHQVQSSQPQRSIRLFRKPLGKTGTPLIITFLICRAVVTSKLGQVLIVVRDAESRTRFLGYRVNPTLSCSRCRLMAGSRCALCAQVSIINPGEFAPGNRSRR